MGIGWKVDLSWRKFVEDEIAAAREKHAPYNSAHEAYAVILEELDEFWDEVKKKREKRDPVLMFRELVQIAATAERAAYDLGLIDNEPLQVSK